MMDVLSGLLKSAAPALATAVAGPLGPVALKAISGKLGVEDTVEAVTQHLQANPMDAEKLADRVEEMDSPRAFVELYKSTYHRNPAKAEGYWLTGLWCQRVLELAESEDYFARVEPFLSQGWLGSYLDKIQEFLAVRRREVKEAQETKRKSEVPF